jgi:hypothetical protein
VKADPEKEGGASNNVIIFIFLFIFKLDKFADFSNKIAELTL